MFKLSAEKGMPSDMIVYLTRVHKISSSLKLCYGKYAPLLRTSQLMPTSRSCHLLGFKDFKSTCITQVHEEGAKRYWVRYGETQLSAFESMYRVAILKKAFIVVMICNTELY